MLEEYKNLSFMERITLLRAIFAQKQNVKTGVGVKPNAPGNFNFLQLSDFQSEALIECNNLGLLPVINVSSESATMTVYDVLGVNEPLSFSTPTCYVENFGQAIQGIGSQISYSRRYLWYLFLEITTKDDVDEGKWLNKKQAKTTDYSKNNDYNSMNSKKNFQPNREPLVPQVPQNNVNNYIPPQQGYIAQPVYDERTSILNSLHSLGFSDDYLMQKYRLDLDNIPTVTLAELLNSCSKA